MTFTSSSKDFFYETSASSLSYYITVDGTPYYFGKAIKSPDSDKLRLYLGKRVQDYLDSHMPDFREYDGVSVPHPHQMRVFGLYSSDGTLLEEYTVLMDWDGFEGEYEVITFHINGHADPRQKLFWTDCLPLEQSSGSSGNTAHITTDEYNGKVTNKVYIQRYVTAPSYYAVNSEMNRLIDIGRAYTDSFSAVTADGMSVIYPYLFDAVKGSISTNGSNPTAYEAFLTLYYFFEEPVRFSNCEETELGPGNCRIR